MLLPRLETNPAKVMLTPIALDMIASLVLLNGRLAVGVGASLGVHDEPKRVSRGLLGSRALRLAQLLGFDLSYLLEPGAPRRARRWLVTLLETFPAEVVTVAAVHR